MSSVSSTSAACFIVAQSDWLPMMMATGLAATNCSRKRPSGRKTKARIIDSGRAPASRERPMGEEYLDGRSRALQRARAHPAGQSSRDDVGGQLVLDEADAVAQHQLALLEPLDLENVRAGRDLQRLDRGVEIAMLLPQPRKLRPQLAFFFSSHRRCRIHL